MKPRTHHALWLALAMASASLCFVVSIRNPDVAERLGASGIPMRYAPLGGSVTETGRLRDAYGRPLLGPCYPAGQSLRIVAFKSACVGLAAGIVVLMVAWKRSRVRPPSDAPPRLAHVVRRARNTWIVWCSIFTWIPAFALFFAGWVFLSRMEHDYRALSPFMRSTPYLSKAIDDSPTSIAMMLLGHILLAGMLAGRLADAQSRRSATRWRHVCPKCSYRIRRSVFPCPECGYVPPPVLSISQRAAVLARGVWAWVLALPRRMTASIPLWKLLMMPFNFAVRRWRVWTPVLALILATAPISLMLILSRLEILLYAPNRDFLESVYFTCDDFIYRLLGFY